MKIRRSCLNIWPKSKAHNSVAHSLSFAAAILGLACFDALGLGSRIPNQDAAAIARGNAFVATADNPSAMYYNPAGISQLEGQNVQAGSLFYLNIYADYVSPSGEKTKNITKIIPVPQLGYTLTLKDMPFSFGLGVYAPFGLGMEWPDNAPFRNAALEAKLTYITVNPVVAWRPHPTLSIAIRSEEHTSELQSRPHLVC